MTKEVEAIIAEIEHWNEQDKEAFSESVVPFDGTFVFAARQRKLQQLRKLLQAKTSRTVAQHHPTRTAPCPSCGWDGSYQTDEL